MIKSLLEASNTFYTPMGIEKELYLINEIQKYNIEEIKPDLQSFYSLLQLLYDSHGDDYIYVDESNEKYFVKFIYWLKNIEEESFIDKDFIESLRDTFSVNTCLGD